MPKFSRFAFILAAAALAGCSADARPSERDTGGGPGLNTDVNVSFDVVSNDTGYGDDAGDATEGDASADVAEDGTTGFDIGPVCGNGFLEAGEVCDDGNNFSGDGCNAVCSSTEICGNGVIDLSESCDDGNTDRGDGCDDICRVEEGCGNGIVDVGEQCDDGNLTVGDGCSSACVREVFVATDTDGDNISDFDEGNGSVDTDGDGFRDNNDLDSDGDGIPDAVEAGDADLLTEPADTDGDGVYNFRDRDSDGDGIPDSVEGISDGDGDGLPNFMDTDSDGDFVPDSVEGTRNTDADLWPDYIDTDSDNDGILDAHELFADSDLDGIPNRLDYDSDNDGSPDSVEAGDSDPETYPIDTDGDGLPDYIDTDSDGDGLPDTFELGCPTGSDRLDPDSDNDGYSDLAEVLVGSNPCTFTNPVQFREFTDFFFILPAFDPAQEAPLEFSSDIQQADVAIAMDTTGSMGGEINNLRSSFSSIFTAMNAQFENIGFAVSTFDDFLCGGHGSGQDRPFILRQRVTTNTARAQAVMNAIPLHSGADVNESGYESMYQVATGAGVNGCSTSVPAFNPASGRVAGVADGTIGGVGFRDNSFPILVHVTDAPSHEGTTYGSFAATRAEAVAALNSIKARFIGVASGSSPRGQLESVANATGGVVPTCAWDGARPASCGSSQCCTGINGSGRGSSGGMCPLVFDIDSGGGGLGTAIVTAIRALVNTTSFTVSTRIRRDNDEFIRTGVDSGCFIQSVTPADFRTTGSCTTTPFPADLSPVDGNNDSFRNVTPGTQLFFDVVAENNGCVLETDQPQAFSAFIDVIGDDLTVLDTQLVTIIVPADNSNPSTVP